MKKIKEKPLMKIQEKDLWIEKEVQLEWNHVSFNNLDLTKEEKMSNVVNEYIRILKDDPGLPPSLVGRKWISIEAFSIFKEIRGILLGN